MDRVEISADNQRWKLKDDLTLENYDGITIGDPTWTRPDTKWAFREDDNGQFEIENTLTGTFLFAGTGIFFQKQCFQKSEYTIFRQLS